MTGDPTDSAAAQVIPVADVAGEGPVDASGVQVDTSATAAPDAQEAAQEPEVLAVEAVEVLTPIGDAADAFVVAYASDGGAQNGAGTYATADSFEPVAVAYETVSYEAPTPDAYVPPVPETTDGGFGTADASEAAADSTDAGLESWQTPEVVIDTIGVDTATGEVVEVVEVFAAEPDAPTESAPAETSAPVAEAAPAAAITDVPPPPVTTPEPVAASAPVAEPVAAPVAEPVAEPVAAPVAEPVAEPVAVAAPMATATPVAAAAPAVARMTTATPSEVSDGGGVPAALIGLLALIVLAAVVVVVLYLTGTILQ